MPDAGKITYRAADRSHRAPVRGIQARRDSPFPYRRRPDAPGRQRGPSGRARQPHGGRMVRIGALILRGGLDPDAPGRQLAPTPGDSDRTGRTRSALLPHAAPLDIDHPLQSSDAVPAQEAGLEAERRSSLPGPGRHRASIRAPGTGRKRATGMTTEGPGPGQPEACRAYASSLPVTDEVTP